MTGTGWQRRKHTWWRWALGTLAALVLVIGVWIVIAEPGFPRRPPAADRILARAGAMPLEVGDYDVLGRMVTRDSAIALRASPAGRRLLNPARGAVRVTPELLQLGREAFYLQTFGNEVFITDVLGAIDGPINLRTLGRAILALDGGQTTNLAVRIDRDVTVGGRRFARGTVLRTGLDVPRGSRVPLGMRMHLTRNGVKVGVTCAACHATVDAASGRVIEGAPNADLEAGLLLAMATNSAAFFRQSGTNPTVLPAGARRYVDSLGHPAALPDARQLEDSADVDFLAWAPGNFDSSADLRNDPTQIPSSFTCGAWPYGWSGFASVGWFHGLTTLNNNVHAVNSDPTTAAEASLPLLGIPKDVYLGVIFQNASRRKYRLRDDASPSEQFRRMDPTPGVAGLNSVIPMPGFPRGSIFILDGLMANTPGRPVASELNGMSAWQHTLAPPRSEPAPAGAERGAAVFRRAGCATCHAGPFFTNHAVVPVSEVGSQPARARALAAFPRIFTTPRTYPPTTPVPLPARVEVLDVPVDITPESVRTLAYALDGKGGYKVPGLIGLARTAPYLHDGGVAAGSRALARVSEGWYQPERTDELGLPGTLLRGVMPEPAASLRVLVDRTLRAPVVAANRGSVALGRSNADGSGHAYWVDRAAGFTSGDQDDLVAFLLSINGPSARPEGAAAGRLNCADQGVHR